MPEATQHPRRDENLSPGPELLNCAPAFTSLSLGARASRGSAGPATPGAPAQVPTSPQYMEKLSQLAYHPLKMQSCYEKMEPLRLDGLQQRFDVSSTSVFKQRAQIHMREVGPGTSHLPQAPSPGARLFPPWPSTLALPPRGPHGSRAQPLECSGLLWPLRCSHLLEHLSLCSPVNPDSPFRSRPRDPFLQEALLAPQAPPRRAQDLCFLEAGTGQCPAQC